MDKEELITFVLNKEMNRALGCTEVGIIGYTVAKAKPEDPYSIEKIELTLDKRTFKNAFAVAVPNTGKFGILPAVVGGLLGDPKNKLEVFKDIKYDEELERYIKDRLKVNVVNYDDIFCRVKIDNRTAETIGSHTGEIIPPDIRDRFLTLSPEDFKNYIENLPKEIIPKLKEAIKLNKELTNPKAPEDFISLKIDDRILNSMIKDTASAVYNRMIGIPKSAMAIGGSGNMGIMATVPIIAYDQETEKDEDKLLRSIALSSIMTIYATYLSSYISPMCGCVNRGGIGATAGLTYYIHGFDKVDEAVKTYSSNLAGLVCDGGKTECALKLASAVFSSYLAANSCVKGFGGIIGKDMLETLRNVSRIEKSMNPVEDKIIDILKEKMNEGN
ncbi:L-serine ammonia-lyase, iron-sulfur-dependent, subunit alpha [Methanocaldococcus infernus]